MRKFLAFFILLITVNCSFAEKQYPDPFAVKVANPISAYEGESDEDLSGIMVPIPMKDRVFNKTGIQCVWATLECIGRYANEPKLINLTDLRDCKNYASPFSVSRKLTQLDVKFKQTNSKSDVSLIIKSIVDERRGCLFSVPGHAMTLVHYDEKNQIVKYINNSDPLLLIRTWSMTEFQKRWDGWICTIYADQDIIPSKYKSFKIIDRNGPQGTYEKDYIILPRK